jgi:Tol biopolymer transport system component
LDSCRFGGSWIALARERSFSSLRPSKFALPKRFLVVVGATVGVSLAVVAGVPGASQTFPGRNGKIVVADGERLYLVSPDGTGVRDLGTPFGFHGDPAWSPDGKRIAFPAGETPDYAGLAVINAEGSGLHTFIKTYKHGGDTCCLSWSPDGTRLAYTENVGDTYTIYVMSPKRPRRNPDYSPVGTKIFEAERRVAPLAWLSGMEIIVSVEYSTKYYAVRANGSGKRTIKAPWRGGESSPDRTMIAYLRWKKNGVYKEYATDAQSDIFIANANGSHARKLVGGPENEDTPVWSPDGKRI